MQSTLTEGFRSTDDAGRRTGPFLFRVLDADAPVGPSGRFALSNVDSVLLGRGAHRGARREVDSGVRVLRVDVPDRWMSGQHARLSRVLRQWVLEDAGSKNGVRLNGEAVTRAELADGDVFELGRTFFVFRAAQPLGGPGDGDAESDALPARGPGLATLQPALAERLEQLEQVARLPVTVALTGESGTGKEVLARAVHALSGRGGPCRAAAGAGARGRRVRPHGRGRRARAFRRARERTRHLVK